MTEPAVTTSIEVRVAIRRNVVASFDPAALSRDTGIPVEILLTSFDTWDDATAENFMDHMTDDDGYRGQSIGDWSTVESYKIKESRDDAHPDTD